MIYPTRDTTLLPLKPCQVVTLKSGQRVVTHKRWGLLPSWAKDIKFGVRTINARSETVDEKPAFRSAFKRRRCLVPASGYFEWKKLDAKTKQPYNIVKKDRTLFAMAGLWETWKNPADQNTVESFTVITVDSNTLTSEVHDRMPAILSPQDFDVWLDSEFEDNAKLKTLLKPYDSDDMELYPVNRCVGNVRNKGSECIEPWGQLTQGRRKHNLRSISRANFLHGKRQDYRIRSAGLPTAGSDWLDLQQFAYQEINTTIS